jgi:hypothetical protein
MHWLPSLLHFSIERILPARKDRPVSFDMPRVQTIADSVNAAAAIASAVADGELTPMEAAELSKVVDGYTRAVETADLAARSWPPRHLVRLLLRSAISAISDQRLCDLA